jgi:hypothetical protein
VTEPLDFLEPHIRPEWLIPQFRHHALTDRSHNYVELEGQQQVLRATFPAIRDSVRELVGRKMDALAREFAATDDMTVKNEIDRLAREYGKLGGRGSLWRDERSSLFLHLLNLAARSEVVAFPQGARPPQ